MGYIGCPFLAFFCHTHKNLKRFVFVASAITVILALLLILICFWGVIFYNPLYYIVVVYISLQDIA